MNGTNILRKKRIEYHTSNKELLKIKEKIGTIFGLSDTGHFTFIHCKRYSKKFTHI